ncbi:MAG: hydroxyacylglutathione hydrolase [Endozoicomonadaceae bacterium]|nr:hydroxyacylglutathione hydrolase [Endozoicomonadaceae bacterium]
MDDIIHIKPIPALIDNYIWVIHFEGCRGIYIIDPGEAKPVIEYCEKYHLKLKGVLITHHHADHTQGLPELLNWAKHIKIYGPMASKNKLFTHTIDSEDYIQLPDLKMQILKVPGHTLDHIAYYNNQSKTPFVFVGDTLFSGGCGKLFEGDAEMMLRSLETIEALPDHTEVYCAHEYTLANLKFAQLVEPNNLVLRAYVEIIKQKRLQGLPSLPSTIAQEKQINPFLRTREKNVMCRVLSNHQDRLTSVEVFAKLRQWKDSIKLS